MTAPARTRKRGATTSRQLPDGFITGDHWTGHLDGREPTAELEREFLSRFTAAQRPSTGVRFVDFFCGAGGEAQGLHNAGMTGILGANHWDVALESHWRNFPDVDHFKGDIQERRVVESMPYAEFFWASPSCPAWSQASGEARTFDRQPSLFDLDLLAEDERALFDEPGNSDEREKSRALMWDVPRYLKAMRDRDGKVVLAGVVENVVECRKWIMWDIYVGMFRQLGYKTRLVAANSMHFNAPLSRPAPQSRDRLYLCYWHESLGRDPDWEKWLRPEAHCPMHGRIRAVQSWKRSGADMGRYKSQYVFRCGLAECRYAIVEPFTQPAITAIDLALPTVLIADRAKRGLPPLAPKTRARIGAGIFKHRRPARQQPDMLVTPSMLVPTGGSWRDGASLLTAPMPARTTTESDALLVPLEGCEDKEAWPATLPFRTQAARHDLALVMRNNVIRGSEAGQGAMCTPLDEPLRTLTTAGHQSLIQWQEAVSESALLAYDSRLRSLRTPMPTQTAVEGDALIGSITDDDVDACTLRMLDVAEIATGMAFGADYVVIGNKRQQVRQLGNAVTPNVAEVLGLALLECMTGESAEPAVAS